MLFPASHFYSPVVVLAENDARAEQVWQARNGQLGIELLDHSRCSVFNEWLPQFVADDGYLDEENSNAPTSFFNVNDQFSWLDARALVAILRQIRPSRTIEIGSCISSLRGADRNSRIFARIAGVRLPRAISAVVLERWASWLNATD